MNNLNQLTVQELLNKQKTVKVVSLTLAIMLLLLLSLGVYLTILSTRNLAFIIIPFALSSILVMNVLLLKNIKKELNKRVNK